jgi:hypothetical protein
MLKLKRNLGRYFIEEEPSITYNPLSLGKRPRLGIGLLTNLEVKTLDLEVYNIVDSMILVCDTLNE